MIKEITLPLQSTDWGEANRNPMVRAYGKKFGSVARCKSCTFCTKTIEGYYTCEYRFPVEHDIEYIACRKYVNKKQTNGGNQS